MLDNEEAEDISTPLPLFPEVRKPRRRSSLAVARRLSRASAAVGISLEEQLEIVPTRDEADTAVRLNQVVNLCMRAAVRAVEEMMRDAEEEQEDLEGYARTVSNFMRQKELLTAEDTKELAAQLDSSVLTVLPQDLASSKLKAIRDYTAKLSQEKEDWNAIKRERKAQYKNAGVNLQAAKEGKLKVDDKQKFSLSSEEKSFFNRLPDISAALAQVARHEQQQALLASSLAVAAKRLRTELEEMDRDLSDLSEQLGKRARSPAPLDVRDLQIFN